jgi:hypothetical protein
MMPPSESDSDRDEDSDSDGNRSSGSDLPPLPRNMNHTQFGIERTGNNFRNRFAEEEDSSESDEEEAEEEDADVLADRVSQEL